MISSINPAQQASPVQGTLEVRPSYTKLLDLMKNQGAIIEQKNNRIQKLEKELAQLRLYQNKRREKQLFELFKNKYEIEYKNRVDFQKQVTQYVRNIQSKIANIDKTLNKCRVSDYTDTSLHVEDSSQINHKFLFSSQFSEIPKSPNALFTSPLEVGQISIVNCSSLLSQICNRLQYMQSVVQIVFLKLDKYALEHQNMQKIIKVEKRQLQEEIRILKKDIAIQIKEKEQIKKILQDTQNERNKWVQGIKQVNKGNMNKLLQFQKQRLVQEMVKMTICISQLRKEKMQKENQLLSFKAQEKSRYSTFLERLKEKKEKIVLKE